VVYALRSRKGEITSIHSYGPYSSPRPIEVRVKTGTRFTHREWVGDSSVIAHNSLPYSAVNAQLGGCTPWGEVETALRNLYCTVTLSIGRNAPPVPHQTLLADPSRRARGEASAFGETISL
jgi:hypothetical protein